MSKKIVRKRRTGEGTEKPLADQIKENSKEEIQDKETDFDGDFQRVISTGSTLLDLAISGGRIRGGGIPGGILLEIYGPPSIGKTSLLCEIAGDIQRHNGKTKFYDPEGRLSASYAKIFDLQLSKEDIKKPNTPLDIFPDIRIWEPPKSESESTIHGILIDSTAALASDLEMQDKTDEYQRRAKLFSQELRKTCRTITSENYIVACSNQERQVVGATAFQQKKDTPGGEALKFYASLRLKAKKANPFKLTKDIKFRGKEISRTIGIAINIEVYKSSIWEPYHSAPVYILFDYGIDNIRANLIFLKQYGSKIKEKDNKGKEKDYAGYSLKGEKLGPGIDDAIDKIEQGQLEEQLRDEVIDLWEIIQHELKINRKKKRR